jgi:flagellar FliL protein
MADPTSAANPESGAGDDLPAPVPSRKARLKAVGVVAATVVVECTIAYLFLPSTARTAEMVQQTLVEQPQRPPQTELETAADKEELVDQVEIDLGQFSIVSFQPISDSTLRIGFHLYGTVAVEDQDEFLTLIDENQHRFRELVIQTIRSAEITDLTDAGLGLIKRRISEKTNKLLGQPLLRVVIFSDFTFEEQ